MPPVGYRTTELPFATTMELEEQQTRKHVVLEDHSKLRQKQRGLMVNIVLLQIDA
jgi:hypothetical protein